MCCFRLVERTGGVLLALFMMVVPSLLANASDYDMYINVGNFPVIDGSDSTDPLRTILMCRLLGYDYEWERRPFTQESDADILEVRPVYTCPIEQQTYLRTHCLRQSNTHGAYVNLIDGSVEMVIAARSKSRDEAAYAEAYGITLVEKPIARDALAFIVNPNNPVDNVTVEQLRAIYMGEIVNWSEVGGDDKIIRPYIRNRNSGSQEKFETMVMNGLIIKDFPELQVGQTMMSPYYQLEGDKQGIGFTPFYYYNVIVNNNSTKTISINGVEMTKENVVNDSYPFATNVFAAVRSDLDKEATAYKLFDFLTSPEGQAIVDESGYVALSDGAYIQDASSMHKVIKTSTYNLQGIEADKDKAGVVIKCDLYDNGECRCRKVVVK